MAQDFDDLFSGPEIPRDVALSFLAGLKVAVSDLWVHRAVSGAAKELPANRLAATAGKAMKGALSAAKGGNEGVARKQMHVRHAARAELLERAGKLNTEKAAAAHDSELVEAAAVDPAQEAPVEAPMEEAAGPATPSVDELALFIARMVSHEFKMHQWYTYYGEMLKGLERNALAELCEELAPAELEDAKYFLRRLSVLAPGAVIPVVPNPEATSEPGRIAEIMLAEEQQAVVLLQHLHQLAGVDPMAFQLESMMAEEQIHADKLQQLMGAAPKPKKSKLAAAMQQIQAQMQQPSEAEQAQDIALQELQAQNQQLAAENQDMGQRLQETSSMAQQHAQAAQEAAGQAQMVGEQAAAAEERAMMAEDQASQNMQEAAAGQQAAAMEADAKMRLGIRIQQMRQQLSELVAQDPVVEEGADMPAIPTSTQMGAGAMDPGMDPAAAGADPAAAGAAPAEEAGAAPEEPAASPAEPATKPKPKAEKKDDSKVEVKVGGVLDRAGQLLTGSKAKSLARAASEHLNEAGIHSGRAAASRQLAKNTNHGGMRALHGIGATSAEASEGRAIQRHWDASAAAKKEKGNVNLARAGAAGLGLGAAAAAGGGEKTAGVLHRLVSKLHGAGKQLEDKAKDRVLARGKEVVREIADAPEMKQRLERVARDAGHSAMDQAAKHPALGKAKEQLQRGGKQLAAITAGSGALSAATSIHQGNKTRKAIKEHNHG